MVRGYFPGPPDLNLIGESPRTVNLAQETAIFGVKKGFKRDGVDGEIPCQNGDVSLGKSTRIQPEENTR